MQVSGWGTTSSGGSSSDELRIVTVPFVSDDGNSFFFRVYEYCPFAKVHFANIKISAINNRERLLFIFSLGCKDSYGRNSIHEESMICAGEEGKDSCQVSFYHLLRTHIFRQKSTQKILSAKFEEECTCS